MVREVARELVRGGERHAVQEVGQRDSPDERRTDAARRVQPHCHLDTEPVPDALDHLARIAREAIANAARHGGAENVTVSLSRIGAKIVLRVCDDGCGIERAARAAGDGFGLRSMRERAATLGGYLNHRQRESGGTELEVVLP